MGNEDSGLFGIGNRDPSRRGLNKEIKNKKKDKRKGCPLLLLYAAIFFVFLPVAIVYAVLF